MKALVRHVLLIPLLVGCGADGSLGQMEGTGALQQAVGEPTGGFPSPDERLMIMAINRARSDPAMVKGQNSQVYPARPPVLWNYDLSRGSRFHAVNLMANNVSLMHDSPCPLDPNVGNNGCDGSFKCACTAPVGMACANCASVAPFNACGTKIAVRLAYFTNYWNGEVAAAGFSDTFGAVSGWVNEAMGQDGHRRTLLDQGVTSNVMGAGHAGKGCWASFDVSDTGNVNGLAMPKLPTASISPVRGKANASYRIYATWSDPNSGAPKSIYAVVDGACRPMKRELGSDTLNATYYADVMLNNACHNYWVLARDASDARLTYPTVGSLNVSAGAACNADYDNNHVFADCEQSAADLAMNLDMTNADGAPPRGDLGAAPDLTSAPGDLMGVSADLTNEPVNEPKGSPQSGCDCAAGARRPASPASLLFALLLAALIPPLRQRRRP